MSPFGQGAYTRYKHRLNTLASGVSGTVSALSRKRHLFLYDQKFDTLLGLRQKINRYFRLFPGKAATFKEELDFLNTRAVETNFFSYIFPYPFSLNYKTENVKVERDESNGMFYVMHAGRRLYYHRGYSTEKSVQDSYAGISIEQDSLSPHRYLNQDFDVKLGDVVADLGAAEGNFSLEIVERAKKIFLFECDDRWIEALRYTFAPWKEKVEIISKFASDFDDAQNAKLETVLNGSSVQFIKMDIEGAEIAVLKSLPKILRENVDLKLAICAYHRQSDAANIQKIMGENGYTVKLSDRCMIFPEGVSRPPYFRKCLARAWKT